MDLNPWEKEIQDGVWHINKSSTFEVESKSLAPGQIPGTICAGCFDGLILNPKNFAQILSDAGSIPAVSTIAQVLLLGIVV